MQDTKIEIKKIREVLENEVVEETIIKESVFVEDIDYVSCIFQICLTGKYNKAYTVLTHYPNIMSTNVLVGEDRLFVGLFSQIGVIDLNQDKLIKIIDLDDEMGQIFGIYKFKSGYFIYHETVNCFFDKNFDVVWKAYCIDIFVNPKVDKNIEIHEDYISVFDWHGSKHYYNEQGEYKTEYYLKYDVD